jgi:hypothetical protein
VPAGIGTWVPPIRPAPEPPIRLVKLPSCRGDATYFLGVRNAPVALADGILRGPHVCALVPEVAFGSPSAAICTGICLNFSARAGSAPPHQMGR